MRESKRTKSIIAHAAIVVFAAAGLAIAQPAPGDGPNGPGMDGPGRHGQDGPPRPPRPMTPPVSLEGTVAGYNHAPRGEVDGFVLQVGDKLVQVNLPPTIGSMVPTIAPMGKSVKIMGSKMETDADHEVYEFRGMDTGEAAPAPSDKPDEDKSVHVEGTIKSLNYARRGEIDGAMLDTGDYVHVGPREAKDAGLKVGDKLTADGRATAMADGKQAVDADMLNGKKVERPHPPKHAGGPKGHRGPGDDAGPDGKGADQDPPPPPPQQ
ncbi:MAG: hypothetical protein ACTHLZ_15625 [Tepidisphaeraceae bacterium]